MKTVLLSKARFPNWNEDVLLTKILYNGGLSSVATISVNQRKSDLFGLLKDKLAVFVNEITNLLNHLVNKITSLSIHRKISGKN